jgi:ABC-type phosphate/phosphonate transport system permease subunit
MNQSLNKFFETVGKVLLAASLGTLVAFILAFFAAQFYLTVIQEPLRFCS